jgi:Tol biopolymer transport system component
VSRYSAGVRRALIALALIGAWLTLPAAAAPALQLPPGVPTATSRLVAGRIATVREDRLLTVEAGSTRTAFVAAASGLVADPAWSPTGATIAFSYLQRSVAGGSLIERLPVADLMLVEADGSSPRAAVLHDGPGVVLDGPAWSPDGSSLYHARYRPLVQDEALTGETVEIRRTDLGSGASTTLARDGLAPTVSPDGRSVAFVSRQGGEEGLRLIGTDGADERDLVAPGTFFAIHAPRYSPDGASIAFAGIRLARAGARSPLALLGPSVALAHGAPWEIFTVAVGGGAARQLTQIGEDLPSVGWSADGARLLVQGELGLYLVDPASGATSFVTTEAGYGRMDWRSEG